MMQLWQKHAMAAALTTPCRGRMDMPRREGPQFPASPAACFANLRLSAVQRAAF